MAANWTGFRINAAATFECVRDCFGHRNSTFCSCFLPDEKKKLSTTHRILPINTHGKNKWCEVRDGKRNEVPQKRGRTKFNYIVCFMICPFHIFTTSEAKIKFCPTNGMFGAHLKSPFNRVFVCSCFLFRHSVLFH